MDQNLRAGLDLMLRELRNAGIRDRLQAYADAPGIAAADSDRIRFKQDFHSTTDPNGASDGDVLDGNEDIEYTFTPADSTVRRRTQGTAGNSGAQPMAEHVTRVGFTYFDAAGIQITPPIDAAGRASIRRIHVRLEGAAADGNRCRPCSPTSCRGMWLSDRSEGSSGRPKAVAVEDGGRAHTIRGVGMNATSTNGGTQYGKCCVGA